VNEETKYLRLVRLSVDSADAIDREVLDLDLIDDARLHELLARGVMQRVGIVRVRLHSRLLLGVDVTLGVPPLIGGSRRR
jgi:hypothetical protein